MIGDSFGVAMEGSGGGREANRQKGMIIAGEKKWRGEDMRERVNF